MARGLFIAAAAALFSLVGNSALAQHNGGPPTFADLVRFVDEQGWRVDFGDLCAELDLPRLDGGCVFKQVSVQEIEGRGDPRGFNVPSQGSGRATYVFLFHLGPLIGEFFVVSAEGDLIKAFYRRHGTGYEPLPRTEVLEEFKTDLAYWFANFSRVRQGLEEQRARSK
jgi:hypothetical protein